MESISCSAKPHVQRRPDNKIRFGENVHRSSGHPTSRFDWGRLPLRKTLSRAYHMNRPFGFPDNIPSMSLGFALLMFLLAPLSIKACTIFTLTDTNRTLFCNNEDYDTPQTRIW